MSEAPNIAQQILLEKKDKASYSEIFNKKEIRIDVNWKKQHLFVHMAIQRPYPSGDYIPCTISTSNFFSLMMRSPNFNFQGKASEYSEFLLGNKGALQLMGQRNARIELEERALNYSCKFKNCTQERLETLVNLLKAVSEELNRI